MKNKQFYNVIHNKNSNSIEINIFGEIIGGSKENKWDDTDFTLEDLRDELENAGDFDEIILNISSPGGSVFVASAMMGILQKYKNKGVKIKAYVLGMAASAASYLIMIADEIYMERSAMLMIHKPLISSFFFVANATKLRKIADDLDNMEDGVLVNAYMRKATDKLSLELLKDMLEKETWLSSQEAKEYFNIDLIEDEKQMVANCFSSDILNSYKNIPSKFKNLISSQPINKNNSIEKQKLKLQLELL